MLNKLFKKFRARSSKNNSLSLIIKPIKCKNKFQCSSKKIKVSYRDKNNGNNNFKKILKFLSPRSDKKNKNNVKINNQESVNTNYKYSQDSGWVEMTRSLSQSSLIIARGNFTTSSPVFNRKGFDDFCFDNSIGMELNDIPNIEHIKPLELLNKSNLSYSTIGIDETGINLNFVEKNSTLNFEMNLIRANSDSEVMPLGVDVKDSNHDSNEEFSSNCNNILSQSFPVTCNSTRRESCNKLLKCIVGQMFAKDFDENTKSSDDTSIFIDQNLFKSFDQMIVIPEDDFDCDRKPMRDTLLEISRRKSFFNDNKLSPPKRSVQNKSNYDSNNRSYNLSNDNINISLPSPENYKCNKKFDLLKISEGVPL